MTAHSQHVFPENLIFRSIILNLIKFKANIAIYFLYECEGEKHVKNVIVA